MYKFKTGNGDGEREREKERRIKDGKSRSDDKFKFAKVRNFAIAVEESIVEESFERLKTTADFDQVKP